MPTLINSFSLSSVVGIGTNSPNKNLTVVGDISASKNIWTGGDLTVGGNFTTNGTATFINTNNLNINDTLIYLAASNTANLNDIGIVGHFTDTLNTGVSSYQHTGLVRRNQQGSPGTWTFFSGLTTEPASATNISWTDPTFQYDNLNVNSINSTGASTISVSSTSPALLIQQIGTGPSFKVNDTTNDTSPFVIDTAGNVGVGTATPATPLDVNGVATLRSGSYSDTSIFGVTTQYLSSFRSTSACLLSGTYMSFPAVGVGGQTDTCLLRQIGGNDAFVLSFDLYDNPESPTGQGFAIRTIPSAASYYTTFALSSIQTNFWVDPTGNVGIGTASPNYPLTVNGTVSASNFRAVQGVPSNVDASLNGYSFGADGDTGMFSPSGVRFGTNGAANGLVAFYSNNVEVMRLGAGSSIGGTGTTSYVGIGTTSPGSTLTVAGDISASGNFYTIGNFYGKGPNISKAWASFNGAPIASDYTTGNTVALYSTDLVSTTTFRVTRASSTVQAGDFITVSGLTYTTVNPNGTYVVVNASGTTFDYTVPGIGGTTPGGTAVIRIVRPLSTGYNISTIGKTSAGYYTLNYTTPLNTGYTITGNVNQANSTAGANGVILSPYNLTTTAGSILTNTGGTGTDCNLVTVVAHSL